jgi:uncharacterized Fe-S cluster-containing radical SAM superfamily protein
MAENNKPSFFQHENSSSLLNPEFLPFDPVKAAIATERAVCRGNKRKYSRFGSTINYQTGIATAYTVGCCLRCVFCWSSETRDLPDKTPDYYSPQEVFVRLDKIAQKRKLDQIRISDGEPTIGKSHLLGLLELVEQSDFRRFVLETNGILFGQDKDYVKSLGKFKKIWVRVSIKAGTPESFTQKTGAIPEAFELPFKAIRYLHEEGINFDVATMSADPRFMSPQERVSLIVKLGEIDPSIVLNLEEEMVILYTETLNRLKKIGWSFKKNQLIALQKIPFLRRFLQVSYHPISSLARMDISRSDTLKAIKEIFHTNIKKEKNLPE